MTVIVRESTAYTTQQARIDLAAAHRLVVRLGLKDIMLGNHFTLVDPANPSRLLSTPEYECWPLVTASGLQVIESEEQAAADQKLWINYRIHWPIHQARPDAACVLHLHPTYLSALSMIDDDLGHAHQGALFLNHRVGYTDRYDGAVGGEGMEQGRLLARVLGDDKSAVIMRNHGVVVVGPTVAHAFLVLANLEEQARVRVIALSTGRPLLEVPPEDRPDYESFSQPPAVKAGTVAAADSRQLTFAALKRLLDRFEPDYRN
jgi:ribulose-5-phosphate 4-epimerase/fuculose-1-phosphate aldolase